MSKRKSKEDAMPTLKPLLSGEVEILSKLWESGPSTSGAIVKALEENGLDRTTVQTRIRTMVEKGLLVVERKSKPRVYAAGVDQPRAIEANLRDLLRRFFPAPRRGALHAFIDERTSLTPAERDEIKAAIEKIGR